MSFKENITKRIMILRVRIVPFFIYAIFGVTVLSGFTVMILFFIASLSDYLEGYPARKFNISSKFGEFLDPSADKLLVGGDPPPKKDSL
jgi:CDP-diacylglycerol--glycerol-3-phosphate 3-phosphatidyltransferase